MRTHTTWFHRTTNVFCIPPISPLQGLHSIRVHCWSTISARERSASIPCIRLSSSLARRSAHTVRAMRFEMQLVCNDLLIPLLLQDAIRKTTCDTCRWPGLEERYVWGSTPAPPGLLLHPPSSPVIDVFLNAVSYVNEHLMQYFFSEPISICGNHANHCHSLVI